MKARRKQRMEADENRKGERKKRRERNPRKIRKKEEKRKRKKERWTEQEIEMKRTDRNTPFCLFLSLFSLSLSLSFSAYLIPIFQYSYFYLSSVSSKFACSLFSPLTKEIQELLESIECQMHGVSSGKDFLLTPCLHAQLLQVLPAKEREANRKGNKRE